MSITEPTAPDARAIDNDDPDLRAALAEAEERGRILERAEWEHEVRVLNGILNEAADANDLCSAYESTLDAANNVLIRVHLTGREREHRARITLDVTYTTIGTSNSDGWDDAEGIARAIYNGADNMGGLRYVIDGHNVEEVD